MTGYSKVTLLMHNGREGYGYQISLLNTGDQDGVSNSTPAALSQPCSRFCLQQAADLIRAAKLLQKLFSASMAWSAGAHSQIILGGAALFSCCRKPSEAPPQV